MKKQTCHTSHTTRNPQCVTRAALCLCYMWQTPFSFFYAPLQLRFCGHESHERTTKSIKITRNSAFMPWISAVSLRLCMCETLILARNSVSLFCGFLMFHSATPTPLYKNIPSCSSFIPPCTCEALWPCASCSCPLKLLETENHDHQWQSEEQQLMRRLLQFARYLRLQLLLAPPHSALCAQRRLDDLEMHARALQRCGKLTNSFIGDISNKSIWKLYISFFWCQFFNTFLHQNNNLETVMFSPV